MSTTVRVGSRLKLTPQNSMCVAETQVVESFPLSPMVYISRKLDWQQKNQYSNQAFQYMMCMSQGATNRWAKWSPNNRILKERKSHLRENVVFTTIFMGLFLHYWHDNLFWQKKLINHQNAFPLLHLLHLCNTFLFTFLAKAIWIFKTSLKVHTKLST